MKREKQIKIRLTPDEHEHLINRAGDIALAQWMREFCMTQNKTISNKTILELDPIARRQLVGISTNINQIAKSINSNKFRPADVPEFLMDLKSCRDALIEISQAIKNHDSR